MNESLQFIYNYDSVKFNDNEIDKEILLSLNDVVSDMQFVKSDKKYNELYLLYLICYRTLNEARNQKINYKDWIYSFYNSLYINDDIEYNYIPRDFDSYLKLIQENEKLYTKDYLECLVSVDGWSKEHRNALYQGYLDGVDKKYSCSQNDLDFVESILELQDQHQLKYSDFSVDVLLKFATIYHTKYSYKEQYVPYAYKFYLGGDYCHIDAVLDSLYDSNYSKIYKLKCYE